MLRTYHYCYDRNNGIVLGQHTTQLANGVDWKKARTYVGR